MSPDYNAGFDYAVSALIEVLTDLKVGYAHGGLTSQAAGIAHAIKVAEAQMADIKTMLNS